MGWLYGRRRRRGSGGTALLHTFTGDDSDLTPGAADTGQAAEPLASTVWGIGTNQLKYVSGGTDNNRYIVWDSGAANGTVTITLVSQVAGGSGLRLAFRCTDVSNLWIVADESTRYALYKRVADNYTEMDEYVAVPANNDVVSVVLSGSTVQAYVNDTLRMEASDAFNASATKVGAGLTLSNTNARWDTLRVTS